MSLTRRYGRSMDVSRSRYILASSRSRVDGEYCISCVSTFQPPPPTLPLLLLLATPAPPLSAVRNAELHSYSSRIAGKRRERETKTLIGACCLAQDVSII